MGDLKCPEFDHVTVLEVLESRSVLGRDRSHAGQFLTAMIDLYPVFPEPVTDVIAGGQASTSHIAYHPTLIDMNAGSDALGDSGHMQITGRIRSVMTDFHPVSIR